MLKKLFKALFRKIWFSFINRIGHDFGLSFQPHIVNPRCIYKADNVSIMKSCRIIAHEATDGNNHGNIFLNEGVYLGRNVEIAAHPGGLVHLGESVSIQDNSVLHGDVSIGAHSLLSMNIFIGSTNHQFRHQAQLLIKDQDKYDTNILSKPITIEEDCWIGWGVVVLPGVYIGRGSIIGANSVVTRDVAPYTVHAGTPNCEISKRLEFSPPLELQAKEDSSIPFFYSGFKTSKKDLDFSRNDGLIFVSSKARIILKGKNSKKLALRGKNIKKNKKLSIDVYVNGVLAENLEIISDEFNVSVDIEAIDNQNLHEMKEIKIPKILQEYMVVDLVVKSPTDSFYHNQTIEYGLSTASLYG